MEKIKIVKGDFGYKLEFYLKNSEGTTIDLTGATVTFKAKRLRKTTLDINQSMTIENATEGHVSYTVQDGNFDMDGRYEAEIEVVITGQAITFAGIFLEVKDSIG